MTQQINLYVREVPEKKGPLVGTILAMGLAAVLCVVYWQYLLGENKKLGKRAADVANELAAQQQVIKGMRDTLATRTDPKRLASELAAVKARASEAQEFLALLQRGELGSLDGYAGHFVNMARSTEPGVWLTHLKIHNAGRTFELEGRSLQAESVLRYAGLVNSRISTYGANLSSVEMTPFVGPDKVTTAVAFKLF